MIMLNESVPVPQSPEEPPLAPYDPPEPAPQAIAWRRALGAVTGEAAAADALRRAAIVPKARSGRRWMRGSAVGQS
jgi:hypothetical protein